MTFKNGLLAIATACATLVLLSCSATTTVSQRSAEDLRLSAESFITDNQFTEAVADLAAAVASAPLDADHALRYGEILEALSRWQDARAAYQNALKVLPQNHPRRTELIYRLTLLALFKLDEPQTAEQLQHQLPADTAVYYDIQGVLASRNDDPRSALGYFNQGLAAQPSKEVAGRILQHAAAAYVQLNQLQSAYGALFNAINLADKKPALGQDIETYWNALKQKYGEY